MSPWVTEDHGRTIIATRFLRLQTITLNSASYSSQGTLECFRKAFAIIRIEKGADIRHVPLP
ncbi:hypothetical protein D3C87_2158810 [compost metagenome]